MDIALIISIFTLAFCFFGFFYVKWYIKRSSSVEQLLAEYRSEVNRLNAQIDATTDRDLRLIEERIKTLKPLLEETDKRVSVYVRELERSRSGEALYTSLGRGIRAALNPPPLPQASPETLPMAKAPPLNNRPEDTEKDVLPPVVETPVMMAAVENTSSEHIHVQIAGFHDQGMTPGEIAARLGLSLPEVDLALNLLGRSDKTFSFNA